MDRVHDSAEARPLACVPSSQHKLLDSRAHVPHRHSWSVGAVKQGHAMYCTAVDWPHACSSHSPLYCRTSMATPHASAVAALVWSQRPACSNAVIRCALRASALDLGSHGLDTFFGYGLIQAKAAVDLLAGGCTCPQ